MTTPPPDEPEVVSYTRFKERSDRLKHRRELLRSLGPPPEPHGSLDEPVAVRAEKKGNPKDGGRD